MVTNFKKIEDYILDKGYSYHKDTVIDKAENEILSSTIFLIKDRQVLISIEENKDDLGFLSIYDTSKKEIIESLTAGQVADYIENLEI